MHRSGESGVFADQLYGVPGWFSSVVRFGSFGQRHEPLILMSFIGISGTTHNLFFMSLFIVIFSEDGRFWFGACISEGVPSMSSV